MGRITGLQLWATVFTFSFATTVAFLMGSLASETGLNGWICILISFLTGTGLAHAGLALGLRNPKEYFGLYGHQIVSKPVHTILMLLFSAFFIYMDAFILWEFVDFFTQAYLIQTPKWAIGLLIMFAVACLSQLGATGIFRFAQGSFWLIGLLFLCMPMFLLGEVHNTVWYGMLRITEGKGVWQQIYDNTPWGGELFLLLFFVPELKRPQSSTRMLWSASAGGMYILLSMYTLMLLVMGPKLSGADRNPLLELTGFVRLGDFLQNLDPVIISIWFMAFFIKQSLMFYAGVLTFSHAFSIKSHRLFSIPLAAIVVAMSLHMGPNVVEINRTSARAWATYAMFIEGLPLLYLAVYWLRKKRTEETSGNPSGEDKEAATAGP